jgi:putative transposase
MDGIKHVLGVWVQTSEGARFWAGVCAELANRGIKDVLIVCCAGLTGFPEAIEATWPNSTVQTCVVHLIRAAMRFVNWKDRKAVAAALKPIYQAATRNHSASSPNVVAAFSSAANRTNRNRDQANTAQNTCKPASTPQSMINVSAGLHTPGRRPR